MMPIDPDWGERYRQLSDRLAQVPAVARFDSGDGEEASTLAHALLDIEKTCREISQDLLPRVFNPSASNDIIADTLLELGEAFRHFLYHVRDPRFYRYLPGCEHGNES